jgi:CRP/FNR family nitrogen fixation transcriptional regulator
MSLSSAPTPVLHGAFGLTSLASMRAVSSYQKAQTITSEASPVDYWYCVLAGAARKYTVLSDGRRRIIDFLLPGDYFGFRERHCEFLATDAVLDGTVIARYPRREVEAAADHDPKLAREIRDIMLDAMSRSHARLLILGRVRSIEKVGAFLSEMIERGCDRQDQRINLPTLDLPMSRYDIADYLALSVETVSRALSRLRREQAIRFVDKHRISILDRRLLESRMVGGLGANAAA